MEYRSPVNKTCHISLKPATAPTSTFNIEYALFNIKLLDAIPAIWRKEPNKLTGKAEMEVIAWNCYFKAIITRMPY
jgi:hypothetical protein